MSFLSICFLCGSRRNALLGRHGRKKSTEGYEIVLNIVRPEGVAEKLPVFIFIHGGGWVLGDYPTHRRMVRDLVVLSGCAAVFVNYKRTPEAVYPQQINEIYPLRNGLRKTATK